MYYKYKKLALVVYLTVLGLNVTVISYFWWDSSSSYIQSGELSLLVIAAGRLFGMLGVLAILNQLVLIGRIRGLERSVGQDTLSRYHRVTGYLTFIFISLHAFFIVNGNALLTGKNPASQAWFMVRTYEDVWKAELALICLFAVVGSSIWIVRKRLKYEWWHLVHLLTYATILLAFGHQVTLGTTLNKATVFGTYWLGLYVTIIGTFIYYRLLRSLVMYNKHRFVVTRVVKESGSVTSIYIGGIDMSKYEWNSGQFAVFTFVQAGIPKQQHPFTISYSPTDKDEIRVTVKAIGDYTKQLQQIKKGSKVLIEGPYGVFGQQVESERQVLLVAGGIGITPLRCLFERYARNGRKVTLLYSAKTEDDLVLKSELDLISKQFADVNVVYVCETAKSKGVIAGRITPELIKKHVPDLPGRRAFICGPPVMMNAIEKQLVKSGLPKEKIFSERFSFVG